MARDMQHSFTCRYKCSHCNGDLIEQFFVSDPSERLDRCPLCGTWQIVRSGVELDAKRIDDNEAIDRVALHVYYNDGTGRVINVPYNQREEDCGTLS